jgi:hypothetical protein
MKKKIISEIILKKVIKNVLLEETTWEDIAKLGSEAAKKLADDLKKSSKSTNDNKKSTNTTPSDTTPIDTKKSTYDKKTNTINKNLPEYTVTASKPTVKGGSYIIDMKNPNSKDITVIWGGMPSSAYGAKFMREKGNTYLKNKNVIYSNYENSLQTLKNILKNNGIKDFRIKSVSGYSRGGINAWNEINGSYDFVGLIDPSTPVVYKKLPSNVKLISRWENWGCCPSYKKNLKAMEDIKVSQRIPSEINNHFEMPEIFFKKFSSLM